MQTTPKEHVDRVTVREAHEEFLKNEPVFIDVREAEPFAKQHIPGAINIPIKEFEQRVDELNPETRYLTYCA